MAYGHTHHRGTRRTSRKLLMTGTCLVLVLVLLRVPPARLWTPDHHKKGQCYGTSPLPRLAISSSPSSSSLSALESSSSSSYLLLCLLFLFPRFCLLFPLRLLLSFPPPFPFSSCPQLLFYFCPFSSYPPSFFYPSALPFRRREPKPSLEKGPILVGKGKPGPRGRSRRP